MDWVPYVTNVLLALCFMLVGGIIFVPLTLWVMRRRLVSFILTGAWAQTIRVWENIQHSKFWKRSKKTQTPEPEKTDVTESAPQEPNQADERPRMPRAVIGIILVGLVGLAIATYGLYTLAYPTEPPTLKVLGMIIGSVLAILLLMLVYLDYKRRHGRIRWKFWQNANSTVAPVTPPVQQPVQPAQPTAADVTKRSWNWAPAGKFAMGLMALLLVIYAGHQFYRYATTPENEIVVNQAWSDPPIAVPPGTDIVWERLTNAAYQIMTADGRIYYFERDPLNDTRTACERHFRIPGSLGSIRFRIVDEEIASTKFVWRYYLYGQAPCAKTQMTSDEEEERDEIPPLPDGIPDEKTDKILVSY
jgi:hypothetical protein